MRVIFIFFLALVTTAQAQQINPVPDYIFRNQMSVGRNAATDTAAYMSVGPRFGAVKGFMPPMVTDTNSVTGVKRNGLLIFSLQLNNFAYWDSTTARFRKITAEATVDSLLFATRAWRQKGDDSLGAIIAVKTDTGLISTKAYRQKGIDSVVTLISTLGGGTVLSVSAGTGMNFSTITTSGAVNADTLILSTKAWRQKGDDSLGAIVGTKVNISDTATMLGAYLRKADTTAMLTPYLRKVDTAAMLTPYLRAAGFGLVKSTYTLSADTAAMATRARVQKGIDSVAGLFTSPDTLTLSTRAWRQKGDDSLGAIIGTKATATGTTNYLSKFTGTSALGNSIVYGTTNEIGISTSTPSEKLDVNGRVRVRTIDSTGTGINMLYSDVDGVIKKSAIPAGGSGTVTSVATGYGLSGGTITTTGTLIVDTSAIATRSRVQKGIDSLGLVKQNVITNPVTGTGTTNYVSKWTGTSTQAISQIFDNGTDVGIGTTSPSYKLDISGTLRNTTGAAFATSSGNVLVGTTTDGGLYKLDVQGALRNTTGANFATSSGIVGVGHTRTSGAKLQVDADISTKYNPNGITGGASVAELYNASTSDTIASTLILYGKGVGDVGISTISGIVTGSGKGNLTFGTRNTSASSATIERMRITADGNVGIGNTAPSEKLHVTGRIRATTIDSTATGMNMLYADANGVIKKAAVPSGGSGTVTSITAGTGLTGGTITTSGTIAVDTASIATRARVQKGIDSVTTLANTKLSGTGISGYFPKWTGTSTQDTSQLFQLGRNIGIGTASPAYRLHLPDAGSTADQAMISGMLFGSDGNGVVMSPGATNLTIKGGNTNGLLYSAAISSVGRWGINTISVSDAVFTVNGDVKIVTIDSTSTARNMLYQDANGVIKKSIALSMADDVMTASGSWVATKDAGSGVTINNVAYTTNGTTKMVTVDGNFYIPEASWTDATWVTISTIPSGYRPTKTLNWNSSYIISGAEYERSDNTDFTGACDIAGQMRIRDDGTVQINATMSTNSIAAGGTAYILIQFTQSYIIK